MTPATISVERLRELLAAGTTGPWRSYRASKYWHLRNEAGEYVMEAGFRGLVRNQTDCALIAAMHEALPALLQQFAEREAEVYLLRSWLCDCFVNAGADTDGSTDVHALSELAVQAVIDLRRDYDENEDWKTKYEAAERARDEATGLLRDLRRAYVRLLESGRDRIIELGGQCDPVDVMERGDIDLRNVAAFLAASGGK